MTWREGLHPRRPDGEFAPSGAGWVGRVADAIAPHTSAAHDYAWGTNDSGNPLVGSLNTALRKGAPLGDREASLRDRLDAAFADAQPLEKPITVHRVISGDSKTYYAMVSSAKYKSGTWTDPGYMSTARRRDSALDFDLGQHTVEIQLRIAAGVRVLDVDEMLGDANRYQQHEVLLPRGTTIHWTQEPVPDGPNRVRLIGTVRA